ncbi:AAA family ATPase [Thiomonas sp.]|jgi:ATP-dependent Lon protease|uniref:AAA family ATPase n=1 Tax=Thiomonas sp. TaxID=2047785 RepID=UPI002631269B|nr:AAA family ATPase [Thiomonas sp.]
MLAVAAYKTVFDVSAVERKLHGMGPDANEQLRTTYERMLATGGQRLAIKPQGAPQLDALQDELPNFGAPLRDIARSVALCADSPDPVEIMPMLLLGEPGIGKTHFARRVSELLGTTCAVAPMNALTAGWILSGASSQWKNARPGKVFDTLVGGDYANPVMVVDEIDKAAGAAQYDPLGALYSLLEADTARAFTDEFADVPIDCSSVIWVATANDASQIPEPILSRLNVYDIPAPDAEGTRRIASRLYASIRASHDWGAVFPEEPAEEVLDALQQCKPRELRRLLLGAFGAAKLDGRTALTARDIDADRVHRRTRIGFTH